MVTLSCGLCVCNSCMFPDPWSQSLALCCVSPPCSCIDTVDYIWFTPRALVSSTTSSISSSAIPTDDPMNSGADARAEVLRVVRVLQSPDSRRFPAGMPNDVWGSDHICLVADMELPLVPAPAHVTSATLSRHNPAGDRNQAYMPVQGSSRGQRSQSVGRQRASGAGAGPGSSSARGARGGSHGTPHAPYHTVATTHGGALPSQRGQEQQHRGPGGGRGRAHGSSHLRFGSEDEGAGGGTRQGAHRDDGRGVADMCLSP